MKTVNLFGIAIACIATSILSCVSDDVSIDCSQSPATFTEAKVIISRSCTTNSGCHGSGSSNGPGELLTYDDIYKARTSIKTAVANGTMPRGSTLSADDMNTILCWIENGAPDN